MLFLYPFALALVGVSLVFKSFYGSLHAHRKVTCFFVFPGVSTHTQITHFCFHVSQKRMPIGGLEGFFFLDSQLLHPGLSQQSVRGVPLAHCGWIHAVKGMAPNSLWNPRDFVC